MSSPTSSPTVLIYGANGYTGDLVLAEAQRRGLTAIAAGRSATAVRAVADRHGVPARSFGLDDPTPIAHNLDGVDVVAHCAGPFSATSAPMVDACLATGTHYLDLTGEAQVFADVYARHDQAVAAGVTLVPGVGYDIVPTDYLVAHLVEVVDDAVGADVAMVSRGGFSSGTLRTAVEGLAAGNYVRIDGALRSVRHAHRTLRLDLGRSRPAAVASTPLGDITSAYHGYGLTDITTFTQVPMAGAVRAGSAALQAILSTRAGGAVANAVIDRIPGPAEDVRSKTRSSAWAGVWGPDGHGLAMALDVANTYTFTAASTVHAAHLVRSAPPGAHTPATAFGTDFLNTIPSGAVTMTYSKPQRYTRAW